ncbi:MAG: phosphoglucomutase [Cyanobacteria bacterium J06597_1]
MRADRQAISKRMTTHFAADSASVRVRSHSQHDGDWRTEPVDNKREDQDQANPKRADIDRPIQIEFAPDGWRGLLDSQMNSQMVATVAQALADSLLANFSQQANFSQASTTERTRPAVAIAFDGRRRSREFAHLFARVLTGNDIEVVLADRVTPTPVVSYTAKARQLSAGIAITASHNPPQYNGIKFKGAYGGPFFYEATQDIERRLGQTPVRMGQSEVQSQSIVDGYLNCLRSLVDLDAIGRSGLRVLVDSMGGAGQTIVQELLEPYGCDVSTIYGTATPDFSGRSPEPIEKNLAPLKSELERGEYALGIATDGDADRLGVLLDDGSWLSAQETILLVVDHLVTRRGVTGDIVRTSSVTDTLGLHFGTNRQIHDVQVGFPYICRQLLDDRVAMGFEESGGYGFSMHLPERDGIFSALLVLEMLAQSGCDRLSDYVARKRQQFGEIFYHREDLHYRSVSQTELNRVIPRLVQHPPRTLAGYTVRHLSQFHTHRGVLNGVKFYLEGSPRWLMVRASETEPLLRLYVEGQSERDRQALIAAGLQLLPER